jgi:hypothetical protein
MQIDSPAWQLKKTCPCCKEGYLILHTCENCNKIVAICDEVGTIFNDPLNISAESISDDGDRCPACKQEKTFSLSKDFELINLGLTTNDYE